MSLSEPTFTLNQDKFRAAVHFLCDLADRWPNTGDFGMLKLHKMLFYAEATHYLKTGSPIAGETFVKRNHGPMSTSLQSVLEELRAEGMVEVHRHKGRKGQRHVFRLLALPNSSPLSDREQKDLETEFLRFIGESAKDVSDFSHNAAWESAAMGEPLPYGSVVAHFFDKPSDRALEWINTRTL